MLIYDYINIYSIITVLSAVITTATNQRNLHPKADFIGGGPPPKRGWTSTQKGVDLHPKVDSIGVDLHPKADSIGGGPPPIG